MAEAVRLALRSAVASTSAALILIVALNAILIPDVAALGAYFPIVCTAATTAQTFVNVRDNLFASAIGVAVGAAYIAAVPAELLWVRAGTIWIPLLLISLVHGFPWIAQRSALFGAYIAFMTTLIPGPAYSFILVQSVALFITLVLSMAPRPLGGARAARDVFADRVVQALRSLSAYYDMLQNRKIVQGPSLSHLEDACYRDISAAHECAQLVVREPWSTYGDEWEKVLMLMDSALLRLSCIHQTLGGSGWEGYSAACIEELWQPALPNYEVLKVRTLCAMDDAAMAMRDAPARVSTERGPVSPPLARVPSVANSDAFESNEGPIVVGDNDDGPGTARELMGKDDMEMETKKGHRTLAAIAEERPSVGTQSPSPATEVEQERNQVPDGSATMPPSDSAGATAHVLKGQHPAVTTGLINSQSFGNLPTLATPTTCRRVDAGRGRMPRCSTGDDDSKAILDVSFDLMSAACRCSKCDEAASISLVDAITANARKRLQLGRGGEDSSEEVSRAGTFAGTSVDFFAHVLGIKRKVRRLGLRKPLRDIALVVPRFTAAAATGVLGVLKDPWNRGIVGPLQRWEYKDWRYWTRVVVLATVEYLAYTIYQDVTDNTAGDVRWFWAIISTCIIIKPTAVMSVKFGLQRALGTIVMFGFAYLTVLASHGNSSTLSWAFANTLMVLLAKLAEQHFGPSWAYVPAVSAVTWQLLVLPAETPGRSLTFDYALSRFLGVCVGVTLGIVGSLVIFPQHAMPALFTNFKKTLTVALDSFIALLSAEYLSGIVDNDVLERHRREFTGSMRGLPALLAMTKDENRLWLLRSRTLRNLDWQQLVKHMWALRRALAGCVSAARSGAFSDAFMRSHVLAPLQPYFDDVVRGAVVCCAATIDELEEYLSHGRGTGSSRARASGESGPEHGAATTSRAAEMMESLRKLQQQSWPQYQLLRKKLAAGDLSVWHTMAFSRLIFSVRDYCQSLAAIAEAVNGARKSD